MEEQTELSFESSSLSGDELLKSQEWAKQPGNFLVHINDKDYPAKLKQIHNPPEFLFARGNIALLNDPQIAIVGSRNMSPYGRDNTRAFAKYLAGCGLTITSGMALGVDGVAHQAALDTGGSTIAVLGTGVDVIYPQRHAGLAEQILENNLIISAFPLGTPPRRECFPQRNRIISGLSIGTLVVEAAERSGSLITARFAMEQNREVFAIPGSIHHPLAKGCHYLLKNGAKCVESAQDILEECQSYLKDYLDSPNSNDELKPAPRHVTPAGQDNDYQVVIAAIGYEKTTVDQIIAATGLDPCEIASMLLMLELEGQIEQVAGGYMKRGT